MRMEEIQLLINFEEFRLQSGKPATLTSTVSKTLRTPCAYVAVGVVDRSLVSEGGWSPQIYLCRRAGFLEGHGVCNVGFGFSKTAP